MTRYTFSDMTIKKILYAWFIHRQEIGRREICTHDMEELRRWAINKYGKTHTAASYEREFRRARSQWPQRFRDISNRYPDRNYKTWEIKKIKHA